MGVSPEPFVIRAGDLKSGWDALMKYEASIGVSEPQKHRRSCDL